jgi:type IV pilus assembly protein PilM
VAASFSDKPRLTSIGLKKIPDRAKTNLSDSIKALFEESKIPLGDVIISVSGPNVLVRFITMPKMRDEDLKNAIRFEAEKFIPFNIKDCILDSQVLSKSDRENKVNIMLAAAKKDYVLARIKAVEEAGLSVTMVDVDAFALANSFLKNFPALDATKSFALLNVGASATNLSILRGPSIYFARDVAIGANDFLNKPDAMNYAKQVLSNFMDEVRLSFSYYENQGGMGIDEIYISGGANDLAGLAEAFVENFASKPIAWNPLQYLDAASSGVDVKFMENSKSSFAVASGLVLR